MIETNQPRGRAPRWLKASGVLAAGVLAGGILGTTLGANAATSTPSPSGTDSSATSSADGSGGGRHGNFPPHGSAAHEALEKPVTGANATSAQAAAVKALGGGQAGDVTTDATGTGYEVTVTKSDGSTTEVHLNSSFAVETRGPGGHGPGGGPDGNGPDGNGPGGNGPDGNGPAGTGGTASADGSATGG